METRLRTNLRLLLNFVCCSKLSTCFWRASTWRLAVSERLFLSRFEQCSFGPSIDDLWCCKYGPVSSNEAPWRFASSACKCARPDELARWRGLFPLVMDDRWCVCVRCVGDMELCWPSDERWHAVKFGTEPLRDTRLSFGERRGVLRMNWVFVNGSHRRGVLRTHQSIFEKWTNAAVWALLDCAPSPGDVLNRPIWLSQRPVCDPTAWVDDIAAAIQFKEKRNVWARAPKIANLNIEHKQSTFNAQQAELDRECISIWWKRATHSERTIFIDFHKSHNDDDDDKTKNWKRIEMDYLWCVALNWLAEHWHVWSCSFWNGLEPLWPPSL